MKRILILPCLLIVIASAVAVSAQTESATWKRYTVKGEEFSVELPTLPSLTTRHNQKTESSNESWQRYFGAYADGIVYTIYSLQDDNPQKALKKSTQGIGSHLAWDRDSERELTQDSFKGKQVTAPHPLGATAQLFATKTRFYSFQAVGAPADDPRVQRFFSSLVLGNNDEAIEVTDGDGIPWEPPSNSDNAQSYTGKEVDRKALLIMKIEPSYTEEARQAKVTGTVVLKGVFQSDGRVTNLRIESALPYGLTENAITATKRIKFIPAVKEGKFVSMWMQFEYNFNLY